MPLPEIFIFILIFILILISVFILILIVILIPLYSLHVSERSPMYGPIQQHLSGQIDEMQKRRSC